MQNRSLFPRPTALCIQPATLTIEAYKCSVLVTLFVSCIPPVQVTSTDSNDAILWSSDRKLPTTVGNDTPKVIKQLVAGLDFDIAASDTQFVVHTGGPAILKGTQEVLGLPDEQMQVSRIVAAQPQSIHCDLEGTHVRYNWHRLRLSKHYQPYAAVHAKYCAAAVLPWLDELSCAKSLGQNFPQFEVKACPWGE